MTQIAYTPKYRLRVAQPGGNCYSLRTLISFQGTVNTTNQVGQATITLSNPANAIGNLQLQAMDVVQFEIADAHSPLTPVWTGFIDSVHRVYTPGQGTTVQINATSPYKLFEVVNQTANDALQLALSTAVGVTGAQIVQYAADRVTYPRSNITFDKTLLSGAFSWGQGISSGLVTNASLQSWSSVIQGIQADSGAEFFFDGYGKAAWRLPQYLNIPANPYIVTPDKLMHLDLSTGDQGVVTEVEVRFSSLLLGQLPNGSTGYVGSWVAPKTMSDHLRKRHLVISATWITDPEGAKWLATTLGQMYASGVITSSCTIPADPLLVCGTVIELQDPYGHGTWNFYVSSITYQLQWGSSWAMSLGLTFGRREGDKFPYDLVDTVPQVPKPTWYAGGNPGANLTPGQTSKPLTVINDPNVPTGQVYAATGDVPSTFEVQLKDAKGNVVTDQTINGYYFANSPPDKFPAIAPGTIHVNLNGSGPVANSPFTATVVNSSQYSSQSDPSSTTGPGGAPGAPGKPGSGGSPPTLAPSGAGSTLPTPDKVQGSIAAPLNGGSNIVAFGESSGHGPHEGIDISDTSFGGPGTPVHAACKSVVRYASIAVDPVNRIDGGTPAWAAPNGGYGNCVILRAGDLGFLYGHNYSFNCKVGDQVDQGAVIAIEGSSGNTSDGNGGPGTHCHFSVYDYRLHQWVDPYFYLPSGTCRKGLVDSMNTG